jgi:hypothetical protein
MYNYWGQQQLRADQAKEPRIVMINETDYEKAIQKVTEWLRQHYPGLKIGQLAVINQKNRAYGRANFTTANGQRKVVLFDLTKAAQYNLSTSMRMFPEGTVVRILPGAGSAPPRLQFVGK